MPFSFNSYESLLLFLISNSYIFYLRKVYLLKIQSYGNIEMSNMEMSMEKLTNIKVAGF